VKSEDNNQHLYNAGTPAANGGKRGGASGNQGNNASGRKANNQGVL